MELVYDATRQNLLDTLIKEGWEPRNAYCPETVCRYSTLYKLDDIRFKNECYSRTSNGNSSVSLTYSGRQSYDFCQYAHSPALKCVELATASWACVSRHRDGYEKCIDPSLRTG